MQYTITKVAVPRLGIVLSMCKVGLVLIVLALIITVVGPSVADDTVLASIVPAKVFNNLANINQVRSTYAQLKGKQGVYAFFNTLNGKQYIGSAVDLYKRLFEHLSGIKSNVNLQRAFKNTGLQHFAFYVYEFYVDNKAKTLVDLEDYYLGFFPFASLYNLKPKASSHLGYIHTEEAKAKMRARLQDKANHPFFGKKHTEETKLLLSKPGELNPMYGRSHSPKTRKLLSSLKCKNIVGVYDINGELVQLFNSNVEVAKFFNCNKTTVGRYVKSGKLWANKYHIKIIGPISQPKTKDEHLKFICGGMLTL
jgi:group I intron endonuclease